VASSATATSTASAPGGGPAGGGPGFAPPYVINGLTMGSLASVQAKTHEPTSSGASRAPAGAAAITVPAGERRTRRRRRGRQQARAHEFMDMNVEGGPEWGPSTEASDQASGNLGFAGTASNGTAPAAGLATLSSDNHGEEPVVPMIPGTWSAATGTADRHGRLTS
jgi:hypothetical protein